MKTLVSCMAAAMLAVTAQAWAQGTVPASPSNSPSEPSNQVPADGARRAPGSAATDVSPGAAASPTGGKKAERVNKRSRRTATPPVTQGAASSETYDYPVPAPRSRP